MKKYILLLITIVFLNLNLLSQKKAKVPAKFNNGYIISKTGDTTKGYVNYRSYLYLKFRDLNGNRNRFTADDVSGFGDFDNNRDMLPFYIKHKKNIYFLERIITGKYPLLLNYEKVKHPHVNGNYGYSGSMTNPGMGVGGGAIAGAIFDILYTRTKVSPFYFTNNDTLICIPRAKKQFKKTMKKYFYHNEELMTKIESDTLKFKNLIEIFDLVNKE